MSGLGPAACWLAHKRLESWSRMAKERVGAGRRKDGGAVGGGSVLEKNDSATSTSSMNSDTQSECNSSIEVVN